MQMFLAPRSFQLGFWGNCALLPAASLFYMEADGAWGSPRRSASSSELGTQPSSNKIHNQTCSFLTENPGEGVVGVVLSRAASCGAGQELPSCLLVSCALPRLQRCCIAPWLLTGKFPPTASVLYLDAAILLVLSFPPAAASQEPTDHRQPYC